MKLKLKKTGTKPILIIMIKSSIKLNEELRFVLGYFNMKVHSIVFQNLNFVPANVVMSSCASTGNHTVERCTDQFVPEDDGCFSCKETLEFRCGIGWDIMINLTLANDTKSRMLRLTAEPFAAGNTATLHVPLWLGPECVGSIKLLTYYFPNHQSFRCLAIEYNLRNSIALELVNEIIAILNHEQQVSDEFIASDSDKEVLLTAILKLQYYVTHIDELSTVLYKSVMHHQQHRRQEGSVPTLLSDSHTVALPVYKAATLAKSFLTALAKDLRLVRN